MNRCRVTGPNMVCSALADLSPELLFDVLRASGRGMNVTETSSLKGILMSNAEMAEGQPTVRNLREQELNTLWKTKHGQQQVLNLLWTNRDSQKPLQAGDSVFQLILEHEFGPLPV